MKNSLINITIRGALIIVAFSTTACSTVGKVLNPFYETPSEVATLGEKNDKALGGGGASREDSARAALQAMGTYQRALEPQPVNPVMQPAVVRLMWIPDHLNRSGDLIPAHYYYLNVKREDWKVTDAFELEGQLNGGRGGTASTFPYVVEGK